MNDLIDRIQHAQTRAAEDIVVRNLQRQGLAAVPVDQPVHDDELPNNGPRVKPNDIDAQIAAEHSFTLGAALRALGHPTPDEFDLVTLYAIKLRNGFTVLGQSAVASPENFNADIGTRIAREHAVRQIGPFLGFRLRDRLAAEAHAAESPDPAPGSIV